MNLTCWLTYLVFALSQQGSCSGESKTIVRNSSEAQVNETKHAKKKKEARTLTTADFQRCFTNSKMVVVTNSSYFEYDTTHTNDHPVRVLGITTNCLVYFGWLHEIYTSAIKKQLELRKGYHNACADFTPFIMRTENDAKKQLLFLALKRYGRRIMVQSIGSEHSLFPGKDSSETGGVVWTIMNPQARHEQFLSNEFPRDFTYDACISMYYRAFIMGHSSAKTKVLEMKISIDDNDNLVPFITRLVLDVNPILHSPIFGTSFVAKFNFRWGVKNETKGHGFVFIRQLYNSSSSEQIEYKAVAVPMASLLAGTMASSRRVLTFNGHIFQNNHVTVYPNRNCTFLGYYRMSRQLAYPNWTADSLPPIELELGKVTKRKFFNHLRFHRRMSYPHSIHRAQRHGIRAAWIYASPAIIFNCVTLGIIVCGVEWIAKKYEIGKARKFGVSRSYSRNTF